MGQPGARTDEVHFVVRLWNVQGNPDAASDRDGSARFHPRLVGAGEALPHFFSREVMHPAVLGLMRVIHRYSDDGVDLVKRQPPLIVRKTGEGDPLPLTRADGNQLALTVLTYSADARLAFAGRAFNLVAVLL